MKIGNKIYELRKSRNISQEELAYRLNVSRRTLS
ncbi:MAG: helix-turn-helix transcriptional regulator [Clostridia bacterium]|nr:helix-turn-helix transcriptional regulator [Clostridia bacterium]